MHAHETINASLNLHNVRIPELVRSYKCTLSEILLEKFAPRHWDSNPQASLSAQTYQNYFCMLLHSKQSYARMLVES